MHTSIQERADEAIIADFEQYVSSGKVALYKQMGLAVVPGKREGARIWSRDEGRSLINCRASGGVFNLGHCPPVVSEAVKAALDTLDINDHILLSEHRAALARRLADLTPGDIRYTTFGVSGGEVIDFALKIARGYTGRPDILSVKGGYHGHTGLALAAGDPAYREPFGPPLPGFTQVPFGDLVALDAALTDQTAAVLLETIPATAGILLPPDSYLTAVRDLCDRRGALLIADEVQAGLGRAGRLWAIDEWGVVPDFMILGKGLSGAIYPITAACYPPEIDAWLAKTNPFIHVSTFGGSDLGCVAASAMLDVITAPGFLDHVQAMGSRLMTGLETLRRQYPMLVTEVRGRGLMIGVELADAALGPTMTVLLAQQGVLALFANNRPSTMIVMPPLVITPAEADEVLSAFAASLAGLSKMR